MIYSGLRSGLQSPLRSGLDAMGGGGGGGGAPMLGVTQDATSLWYRPATVGEWTQTMAVAAIASGNPTDWWMFGEAAGNAASSGPGGLVLTANGAPLYQQIVPGWAALGIGFNGAANQRFTAAALIGPDPGTTSQLWIWYTSVTAIPGASANLAVISDGATNYRLLVTATPRSQSLIGGATATGTADPTAVGVQIVAMLYDRTNSRAVCYTSQEKLPNTYSAAVVDGRKGIGGALATTGRTVYGCLFRGASAELSDAQIKTLSQTLGATILW